MTPLWLQPCESGCRLVVHVQPGATRTAWVGLHGDALKLRLAAPPVDGAANQALLAFVADWLGVPTSHLRLLRGERSRRKVMWVPLPAETVAARPVPSP